MRKCSICGYNYHENQLETIYDNGIKQICCQYCLNDILPDDVPIKFIIFHNKLTRVPYKKVVNLI